MRGLRREQTTRPARREEWEWCGLAGGVQQLYYINWTMCGELASSKAVSRAIQGFARSVLSNRGFAQLQWYNVIDRLDTNHDLNVGGHKWRVTGTRRLGC